MMKYRDDFGNNALSETGMVAELIKWYTWNFNKSASGV